MRILNVIATRPFKFGDRDVQYEDVLAKVAIVDERDCPDAIVAMLASQAGLKLVAEDEDVEAVLIGDTEPLAPVPAADATTGAKSLSNVLTRLGVDPSTVKRFANAGLRSTDDAANHFAQHGTFTNLPDIGPTSSDRVIVALELDPSRLPPDDEDSGDGGDESPLEDDDVDDEVDLEDEASDEDEEE